MKRLFNILVSAVAVFSLFSCEAELDPIVVYPDVKLSNTGMQTVNTITIYDTDEYKLSLARTEGLSKAAEFDLVINEALLNEYNETNGFNLKLMPESLYSLEHTKIAFDVADKDTVVMLNLKPAATLANAGSVAAAEEYAIPIQLVPTTGSTISSKADALQVMVKFAYEEPIVRTTWTSATQECSFISVSNVAANYTFTADVNFEGVDVSNLSCVADEADVKAYNAAHGTSHVLMPESGYTWGDFVYDAETAKVSRDISVMCSKLDDDKTYLLPIRFAVNGKYTLQQDNIGYIVATITGLSIEIDNTPIANEYVENCIRNCAESFYIDINANAALESDNTFEISYEPSLIAQYNQTHNTHYYTLPEGSVSVKGGKIAAGELSGKAEYVVDMSSLDWDCGYYLVPILFKANTLEFAPEGIEDVVIYKVFRRSLYGTWSNYYVDNGKGYPQNAAPYTQRADWRAETFTIVNNDPNRSLGGKMKYMNPAAGNGVWWGWYWCINWDEDYNGNPDHKPIEFYRNAYMSNFPNEEPYQDNDAKLAGVVRQNSYFDWKNGVVYLDACFFSDYNKIANYNPKDEKGSGGEVIYTRLVGPVYNFYIATNDGSLPIDNN